MDTKFSFSAPFYIESYQAGHADGGGISTRGEFGKCQIVLLFTWGWGVGGNARILRAFLTAFPLQVSLENGHPAVFSANGSHGVWAEEGFELTISMFMNQYLRINDFI